MGVLLISPLPRGVNSLASSDDLPQVLLYAAQVEHSRQHQEIAH
jgi:hypothetical protein